jgi:hypothetical protein
VAVPDDAVAALHAEAAQRGGEGADLTAQPGPGDLDGLGVLCDGDQRRALVRRGPQRLLGVVQRRVGEPHRPRHAAVGQHPVVRDAGEGAGPGGEIAPELVEVLDRPLPQPVVVGRIAEGQAAPLLHPPGEGGDAGGADALVGRVPEHRGGEPLGTGRIDAHVRTMPS